MIKVLLALVIFTMSCGPEVINRRTPRQPKKDTSDYVVVGSVTINVSRSDGLGIGPAVEVITYTTADQQTVTLNGASLNNIPTESEDGLTINLGSIDLTKISVNKLKVCDPGGGAGTQKCTGAIIRVYTNAISGHAAVEGFVNKTDAYGVPVNITQTGGATPAIGHLLANAVILSTYTIPPTDKKLTTSDFTGTIPTPQLVVFPLVVDFSNGGFGVYEMSITVEVALGM